MTDTTDIKALREKVWDLDEAHDLRQLGDDIIDQLEAERQQREASDKERNDLLNQLALEIDKTRRTEARMLASKDANAIWKDRAWGAEEQLEAERQRVDKAESYAHERDSENESMALTVGRLRSELAALRG